MFEEEERSLTHPFDDIFYLLSKSGHVNRWEGGGDVLQRIAEVLSLRWVRIPSFVWWDNGAQPRVSEPGERTHLAKCLEWVAK